MVGATLTLCIGPVRAAGRAVGGRGPLPGPCFGRVCLYKPFSDWGGPRVPPCDGGETPGSLSGNRVDAALRSAARADPSAHTARHACPPHDGRGRMRAVRTRARDQSYAPRAEHFRALRDASPRLRPLGAPALAHATASQFRQSIPQVFLIANACYDLLRSGFAPHRPGLQRPRARPG